MLSIAEKPGFGGGAVRENQHSFPVVGSTNGGTFHHHRVGGISECHHIPTEYWMNQNIDKFVDVLSGNFPNAYYQPSYGFWGETSSAHSILVPQRLDSPKDEHIISRIEKVCEERDNGGNGCGMMTVKKRARGKASKSPRREKKPRTRISRTESNEIPPRSRAPKKHAEVVINGVNMDISELPIPVCSCTETPKQCYRWGSGGWQSACCTTWLSLYSLPLSTKRRGARIAGRKMSIGAFKKVLEKLASEGYNFSNQLI